MKKIVCLIISIAILSISLISCQKKNYVTSVEEDEKGNIIINYSNGDTKTIENKNNKTEKNVISAEINENGELIITYSNEKTENLGIVKEQKTEYVYTLAARLNIRNAPNIESTSYIGTALLGTRLELISEEEYFYKVFYEGQEAYVVKAYTTKDKGETSFKYIDNKKVFSKENITLYQDLGTREEMNTLPKDTVLTQTGINENETWARIIHEGITFYCKPEYLRS